MPLPAATLAQLRAIVGADQVLTAKEDLIPYSFDGTAALNQMPGCVAFVTSTEQIAAILKLANATRTPLVTRGSGTGLSGGSLPSAQGPAPPARSLQKAGCVEPRPLPLGRRALHSPTR